MVLSITDLGALRKRCGIPQIRVHNPNTVAEFVVRHRPPREPNAQRLSFNSHHISSKSELRMLRYDQETS